MFIKEVKDQYASYFITNITINDMTLIPPKIIGKINEVESK